MSKQEFLKHHHQCVQTLCSVGLCDKSSLKRKGILQLLYLLYSADILDKSYYKSLFDCIEQIKESDLKSHYCSSFGPDNGCSKEWKDIIDAFADAVAELRDFNIKVSKHPSKLPPLTPEILEGDFDTYTITTFQKTPDAKIVEHPDFLRAKDTHYRVKKLFTNIKERYPQLQRQQISILTPPNQVFKPNPISPFKSTAYDTTPENQGFDGEPFDQNKDREQRSSRITITKLDSPGYDENPRLRSVAAYPTLPENISRDKEQVSKELFRSSTFDDDYDGTLESVALPPTLLTVPQSSFKDSLFHDTLTKKQRPKRPKSKKSLPWWWTKTKKKKRKSTKKKRKSTKKQKKPKQSQTSPDEKKIIKIREKKEIIEHLKDLGSLEPKKSKSRKATPKKSKSKSRKATPKKSKSKSKSRKSTRKKSKSKSRKATPKKSKSKSRKSTRKKSKSKSKSRKATPKKSKSKSRKSTRKKSKSKSKSRKSTRKTTRKSTRKKSRKSTRKK